MACDSPSLGVSTVWYRQLAAGPPVVLDQYTTGHYNAIRYIICTCTVHHNTIANLQIFPDFQAHQKKNLEGSIFGWLSSSLFVRMSYNLLIQHVI